MADEPPAAIDTWPPTPLFVDPTRMWTAPAVDDAPTPVDNTRLPTVPRLPDPLIIDTAPVLPEKAVPDDISIHPLTPVDKADPVLNVMSPLDVDDPAPLDTVTDPPADDA